MSKYTPEQFRDEALAIAKREHEGFLYYDLLVSEIHSSYNDHFPYAPSAGEFVDVMCECESVWPLYQAVTS